jgi:23S rRNA (adenine2503-C2)-methyltransferase
MIAVNRIINELGIGARRITISTVGIVPIIRRITKDSSRRSILPADTISAKQNSAVVSTTTTNTNAATDVLPQFRLAISLHSASDAERTVLLPANARNGGLNALMEALREYCDVTGRRITIEWALIAGKNDNVSTAQQLGRLLVRHPQYPLRPDLVHVNVIPLNPTAMFNGRPSQTGSVNLFCQTLINEFGISCTPRVRRGIDIDAGCGQLTTKYRESQQEVQPTKSNELRDFIPQNPAVVGVYDDDDDEMNENDHDSFNEDALSVAVDWDNDIELNDDDNIDTSETDRLISLVQGTTINLSSLEQN